MGHDDLQFRKVCSNGVEQERVGVGQFDAVAAGQSGSHAVLAGVENGRKAEFLQGFPEGIELFVGRVEALQARVELESPRAEVLSLASGTPDCFGPCAGIDAAERNQHVIVPGRSGDQIFNAVGFMLELRAGVHGEHHGRYIQFAVYFCDPVQRRRAVLSFEVLGGGFGKCWRQGLVAVAVHLQVDVHVDRIELGGVDAQFVTGGGHFSAPSLLLLRPGPVRA